MSLLFFGNRVSFWRFMRKFLESAKSKKVGREGVDLSNV